VVFVARVISFFFFLAEGRGEHEILRVRERGEIANQSRFRVT
jgi:hypothetical protein